jgi:hypothetical protein
MCGCCLWCWPCCGRARGEPAFGPRDSHEHKHNHRQEETLLLPPTRVLRVPAPGLFPSACAAAGLGLGFEQRLQRTVACLPRHRRHHPIGYHPLPHLCIVRSTFGLVEIVSPDIDFMWYPSTITRTVTKPLTRHSISALSAWGQRGDQDVLYVLQHCEHREST